MCRTDPGVDARKERLGTPNAKADDADDGVGGPILLLAGNDERSPGVSLAAVAVGGLRGLRAQHVGLDDALVSVALPGTDAALRPTALAVGHDADRGLQLPVGPGAPAGRAAPPDDGDRLGRWRHRRVGVEPDGRVPADVGLAVELAHHVIVADLPIFEVGKIGMRGAVDEVKALVGFGGAAQIPPAQFGVIERSPAVRGG